MTDHRLTLMLLGLILLQEVRHWIEVRAWEKALRENNVAWFKFCQRHNVP